MKKYIILIIVFFIGSFILLTLKEEKTNKKIETKIEETEEAKAIFISYIDYQVLKDKDETLGKSIIDEMINNVATSNFNTIILQVRPFADAIYNSKYFPPSKVIMDSALPFDILKYFIEKTHEKNIKIYAWLNPYRISLDKEFKIDEKTYYYKWLNTNKISISDDGIYFNPASDEVSKLILDGVEELTYNYDIDGIIYDDYFYPNKEIDLTSFKEYQKSGGTSSIEDYRKNIITTLIKDTYNKIKSIKEYVLFGISPSGNIENNLNEEYLDIEKLLSKEDTMDFIMPQLYYGLKNEHKPFIDTLNAWDLLDKKKIKIIPTLALYKVGQEDKYAGSGINEWVEEKNIILKEAILSKTIENYGGYAIYRYNNMYEQTENNLLKEERNSLNKLLSSN